MAITSADEYTKREQELFDIDTKLKAIAEDQSGNINLEEVVMLRNKAKDIGNELKDYLNATFTKK